MKTILLFLTLTTTLLFSSPEKSLVRVNSTLQAYNPAQPWEKTTPVSRRGLGCLIKGAGVLTTANMAANSIFLELESADSTKTVPAKVLAIDYEANLALLGPETDPGFLENLTPVTLAAPVTPGETLIIYQVEDNGTAFPTEATVRSMELLPTQTTGSLFLSYLAKASMQDSASSYTLPAFKDGKLLGILTSYDAKDQLSEIIAIDVIQAFLEDAKNAPYQGFPSLGVAFTTTEDPHFRKFLNLPEASGGLYLSRILPGGSADQVGIREGDVILSIAGNDLDRRGNYLDPRYGTLYWTHLISGAHPTGTKIELKLLRDGKPLTKSVTLSRSPEPLVPRRLYDKAPPYLVKGGLIFQELSQDLLRAYGKNWTTSAPLNLLDVLNNPADYEENRRRVVVLTRVIPTAATVGYESAGSRIITAVNDRKIADLADLIQALDKNPENGIHKIEIDDAPYILYLDQAISDKVDQQFLQSGLPALSRLENSPQDKPQTSQKSEADNQALKNPLGNQPEQSPPGKNPEEDEGSEPEIDPESPDGDEVQPPEEG